MKHRPGEMRNHHARIGTRYAESDDGVHWTVAPDFATFPVVHYNTCLEQYVGIFAAYPGVRLYIAFSVDGKTWSAPKPLVEDPSGATIEVPVSVLGAEGDLMTMGQNVWILYSRYTDERLLLI